MTNTISSPTTDPIASPLVSVGGGTMASAVILGGLDAGVLVAERVCVVDRDPANLERFRERRCAVSTDAGQALASLSPDGVVLLAIKPQSLPELVRQITAPIGDRLVISVLAGVSCERVSQALGGGLVEACRVVRAMPNTPARIRKGITGLVKGPNATVEDVKLTSVLFEAVGCVHQLADESQMALFTLLAASGPAYLFYLAEALERAAIAMDMEPGAARRITTAMLDGSIALLKSDLGSGGDGDPAALRAAVTSKGGVTAAAVGVLNQQEVMRTIEQALRAGVQRDAELNGR